MVLGPYWQPPKDGLTEPDCAPPGVAQVVHQAAEAFVADIERAKQWSDRWRNQPLAQSLVDSAASRALARLAETGCWGRANQPLSGDVWRIAGHRLDTGWLQRRAWAKPRGYAGDYELLARVCEDVPCDHPLGRLFDRFFLGQAAVHAVRGRTQQLAAAAVEHCLSSHSTPYRLVSVGSGPALDVEHFLRTLPAARRAHVEVTLLDLDEEALDYARQRLLAVSPGSEVVAVRENFYRLANKPRAAERLGEPDFLICSGLFDYLLPTPAAALLRLFWSRLRPGGALLVGNFAPHNPSRAYMEWIGQWYLIYRTPAELRELASEAGLPNECCTIGAEPLGIDLFLRADK